MKTSELERLCLICTMPLPDSQWLDVKGEKMCPACGSMKSRLIEEDK